MRKNFLPLDGHATEGRCRICDLRYSLSNLEEVRTHRAFHRKYFDACDSGFAPVNEAERRRLGSEGLSVQHPDMHIEARVAGAEKYLLARHHEHLFNVLYSGCQRLDLRAFFTKYERKLTEMFDDEVAAALRYRYSDEPWYADMPPGGEPSETL